MTTEAEGGPRPCCTEEMILNPNFFTCSFHKMQGWRRYRIEYGFECSCPEGVVYLPPHVDIEKFEEFMAELCKTPSK